MSIFVVLGRQERGGTTENNEEWEVENTNRKRARETGEEGSK